MYRNLLLPVTICTVLLTGWVLHASGWLHGHHAPGNPARQTQKAGLHPAVSQAALRYQQVQPRHWRSLMLQR